VLLALLATALLAPRTAQASCGDYVVLGDRPAGAAHAGQPMNTTPANPSAPTPHAPCHGPLCSRNRPHLPLPPVVPVSEQVERWGCVGAFLPVPGTGALAPLPGDAGERPVRYARSVYHPPR
jgi:hypothetical protein